MRREPAYTLLFDGDCRICRACARAVRLLDVRRGLSIRSIQESGGLIRSVPASQRLRAAHAIAPDGCVTSGGEAMPAILAALVADSNFERRVRASHTSVSALSYAYRVMAQVRGKLSCAVAPASAARIPR